MAYLLNYIYTFDKIALKMHGKKFRDLDYIRQYSENFITTDYLSINRDNGQLKINGLLSVVQVVAFYHLINIAFFDTP